MPETLIPLVIHYTYALLFVLAVFEGPVIILFSGFILKMGVISLVPAAIVLGIGDLLGDAFWYGIGRRFGRGFIDRFGTYVSLTEKHLQTAEKALLRYHERIFLTTKTTSGFGLTPALILTAGMARVPFRKFIGVNALGEIGRLLIYLSIGYFFGHLYALIDSGVELVSFIVASAVFVLALFGFGAYLAKKMLR